MSEFHKEVAQFFSPQKQKKINHWQGYMSIALNSTEAGVRSFLSSMKRNGSFQTLNNRPKPTTTEHDSTEAPASIKGVVSKCKDITSYEFLSQIYELNNRKGRNISIIDSMIGRTQNEILVFPKTIHRKSLQKRQQRCASVAIPESELIQVKQVQVSVKETIPKQMKRLIPIPKKNERTISPVKALILPSKRKPIDDLRYWEIGYLKIIQCPSVQEINQIINFTNCLQVLPAQHSKYYKIYVGRGNNQMIVKSIFNMRAQWTIGNSLEEEDLNFIWTQKYVEFPPSEQQPQTNNVINESINGWLDNQDQQLIKLAYDRIENKSKKKLSEYTLESQPIINNLNLLKNLLIINHQINYIRIHNHLRDGNQLGDKKYLFFNLKSYCNDNNIDLWSLIPLTYHINGLQDQQYQIFKKQFEELQNNQSKNIWIIKPGEDSNRGNGIKVANTIQDINSHISQGGHTFILQKYIENPFLYQKRKFDIRGYCLITMLNGIKKVFWYKKGYLRTSSSFFNLESLDNQKIHLTNDAIQNRMNGYGKFEKGNKVSYEQFQTYLIELNKTTNFNYNFDTLYNQMKEFTKIACTSAINKIQNPDQLLGFELYGLDFMVTQDFKPVLIEFNTNPCIETGCPILAKIISGLLENLFRFVIDPLFPAKKFPIDDFNSKNDFELLLQQ